MSAWYNAGRVAHKESVVLNSWRAAHGPETCRTRSVQASNDVLTNLTADELAQRLGMLATSYAGKSVTEASARQVAAVYACVALIAGAVATLPLPIYERTETGRKEIDHDYFWLLNESPNADIEPAAIEEAPRVGMRWRPDYVRGIGKRNGGFIIIPELKRIFETQGRRSAPSSSEERPAS